MHQKDQKFAENVNASNVTEIVSKLLEKVKNKDKTVIRIEIEMHND